MKFKKKFPAPPPVAVKPHMRKAPGPRRPPPPPAPPMPGNNTFSPDEEQAMRASQAQANARTGQAQANVGLPDGDADDMGAM